MYFPKAFADLSLTDIQQKIADIAIFQEYVKEDPYEEYSPHTHETTELVAVLTGQIDIKVAGEVFHCGPGDKLIIPANTVHSAQVGPNGCEYAYFMMLN